MKLSNFFKNAPDLEIEQLSTDSRIPMKNAIFFCLNGIKYDGHDYVDEAINNGAKVIIYSKTIRTDKNVIYVKVNNVNETLFRMADLFYNHPNVNINEYIVSGCYGRSSVSSIIKHYLDKKTNCGYIGIQGIIYNQTRLTLTFPALTALDNLKMLSRMKNENIKNCVFESSPISLYYKKLDVLKPNVFIYTNTSIDSSDYQVCGSNYLAYLRKYLYTLEDNTCVLFNGDDITFNELKDSISNYSTYGKNINCNYRIDNIIESSTGTKFEIAHDSIVYKVETKLLGEIHAYNLTAAIAALNIDGYDIQDIIDNLNDIECIPGVMEMVEGSNNIIIDCAYENDSIENVMQFANKICKGKKIAIIGINYSDDDKRLKRILKIADEYLDVLYVTEDESQESSVISILNRLDQFEHKCEVVKAIYRSSAIEFAIQILNTNDCLLVLGKGCESYMNMGLGKEYYNGDKFYVVKYLKEREEYNEII